MRLGHPGNPRRLPAEDQLPRKIASEPMSLATQGKGNGGDRLITGRRVRTQSMAKPLTSVGLGLFPLHLLERGSDARRVAFFEKPNLNGLCVFHVQPAMPERAVL